MENTQTRKLNYWKIATFVLLILLVISLFIKGSGFKTISKKEAGEKAINYINIDLNELGYNAVLEEVQEEMGLYKIVFTIEGVENSKLNSYVTKDGKLMFPYSYRLDEGLPNIPSEVLNQEPLIPVAIPTE